MRAVVEVEGEAAEEGEAEAAEVSVAAEVEAAAAVAEVVAVAMSPQQQTADYAPSQPPGFGAGDGLTSLSEPPTAATPPILYPAARGHPSSSTSRSSPSLQASPPRSQPSFVIEPDYEPLDHSVGSPAAYSADTSPTLSLRYGNATPREANTSGHSNTPEQEAALRYAQVPQQRDPAARSRNAIPQRDPAACARPRHAISPPDSASWSRRAITSLHFFLQNLLQSTHEQMAVEAEAAEDSLRRTGVRSKQ